MAWERFHDATMAAGLLDAAYEVHRVHRMGGLLLSRIAAHRWHLPSAAEALGVTEHALGLRLAAAGSGGLLREDVLAHTGRKPSSSRLFPARGARRPTTGRGTSRRTRVRREAVASARWNPTSKWRSARP
ncbi:hypothetical protein AB0I60_20830 [Actinosynnema sp. NPDC050436]|uniref:hypothetical protein n=1 Tax=Actinosynnema sp. NPDC050436 TaxID=3155659 RepID=UPI0033D4A63C